MTRQELLQTIEDEYASLIDLFTVKNNSYGSDDEAFHNFTETARRVYGNSQPQTAFRVLLTFMDKHLVALANKGLDDPEVKERLRDIAVYSLIGIAMAKEHELKLNTQGVGDENAQGNSVIPRPTDYY